MIVVDRIEGDRAVLMFGTETVELPLALLPDGTREGDVLELIKNEGGRADALAEAEARLARLRARSNQGPDTTDL